MYRTVFSFDSDEGDRENRIYTVKRTLQDLIGPVARAVTLSMDDAHNDDVIALVLLCSLSFSRARKRLRSGFTTHHDSMGQCVA